MRHRFYVALLLLGLLVAAPLSAQPLSGPATINAGYQSTFLTSGDASANTYWTGVTYRVRPRLALVANGRFTEAIDTGFRDLVGGGLSAWQDRRLWTGDLGARFTVLRLTGPEVDHRFGASGGVSYRHREEEISRALYYPPALETNDRFVQDFTRDLNPNETLYTFGYFDGTGGKEDGRYGLITWAEEASELGGFLSLHYTADVGRLTPGMMVGYHGYLGDGYMTWSYGLHLGIDL